MRRKREGIDSIHHIIGVTTMTIERSNHIDQYDDTYYDDTSKVDMAVVTMPTHISTAISSLI